MNDAVLRPLSGLRVLDFTQNVAGPLAGQICADLGAEVIKVEPPRGEAARHIVSARPGDEGVAPYFVPNNRGKRSLLADLHTPEGVAAVLDLVESADVVLEGFRPGTMASWGLGPEDVHARNPRCVYASVNGYGGRGPHGMRPGVDMLLQVDSGILTGLQDADGAPMRVPVQFIDGASGHVLAQAVLAALLHRERHGIVTDVDVAMFDVAINLQSNRATALLNTMDGAERAVMPGFATSPSGIFRVADGYVAMSAYVPKHWQVLARVLDRPDLIVDPRFATQADRARNDGELLAELAALFADRGCAELVAQLQGAGLMANRVNTLADAIATPVFAENELAVTTTDGVRSETTVRTPARYSAFTPAATSPTPVLGEYNRERHAVA
ncbi:CaiB/BaiF CoA transferase family protein [Nocardia nova]|uniref:CaiB/BaiF CoA transferase family protein n=1 Tax=Nocardia nova TaxID=37330 RepID=UPI0033C15532